MHMMPRAGVFCGRPDDHNGSCMTPEVWDRQCDYSNRTKGCRCKSHDGNESWHGTRTGYCYHACRCELCRAEATKLRKAYGSTVIGRKKNRESWWRKQGIIGMTVERFEKMLADQGNCCYLCGREFTDTPHVDHDHTITDRDNVRHLLCGLCNPRLGWLEDHLNEIADYLGLNLAA